MLSNHRQINATKIFIASIVFALLGTACSNVDFRVNPTLRPSPDAEPSPTPTAEVRRAVPTQTISNGPTSKSVAPPWASNPSYRTPTPLPSFLRFAVTPTPGPPVVLANGQVYPPGTRILSGAPVLADLPESNLMEAFERIQWQGAVSVKSRFHWPVATGGSEQGNEVLVQAEGDYRQTVINGDDASRNSFLLNNASDFRLLFSQESPGGAATVEARVEAARTRLVKDTLGTGLRVYSSLDAWLDDANRETASIAMFMSLALTGGRLVSDDFAELFTFERGKVRETTNIGLYNRRDSMFKASRVNDNGDSEEWRIWLDFYERPERIELTITSEDPVRSVRDAELEIIYSGEVLEPAGLKLPDSG